jgi:hypothetical protein
MRVTTKISYDWDGNVLEHDFYEYNGPVVMCCGPSAAQQGLANAQINAYNVATTQSQEQFGVAQELSAPLIAEFEPIVKAGPDQLGESPAESAAINANIINTQSQALKNTMQATGVNINAEGGGNEFVPQGTNKEIVAALNAQSAGTTAAEQTQALIQNYQLGNQNFWEASQALEGVPSMYGTANQAVGESTGAGSAAETTENQIAQESFAPISALASLGGAAAGMFSFSGKAPCWIAAAVYDGWDDPRVAVIRAWVMEHSIICVLYKKFGERIAEVVKENRFVKWIFRKLFDKILVSE